MRRRELLTWLRALCAEYGAGALICTLRGIR